MNKRSTGEKVFNIFNVMFMIFFSFITVYPFIYALAYSLSSPAEAIRGGITFFPRGFTFENYRLVFARNDIYGAVVISVLRTVVGIGAHLFVCGLAAYGISDERMPFCKPITLFLVLQMYLTAGMIPTYILMSRLHLMNSFWVYILPASYGGFDLILFRTNFRSIPVSLCEAARIDGASDITIFAKIILPLSKSIIAIMALFVGVWQWNSWFDAMLYITNAKLHPLAMLLQRIIQQNEISDAGMLLEVGPRQISPESIKMAMLIITTVPIIMIYPFFQRYFVKGIMVGAVKG